MVQYDRDTGNNTGEILVSAPACGTTFQGVHLDFAACHYTPTAFDGLFGPGAWQGFLGIVAYADHYFAGGAALYLTPALIGTFWGAPLVTRELEAGTLRLAWNQSVTRTRWMAAKLGSSDDRNPSLRGA